MNLPGLLSEALGGDTISRISQTLGKDESTTGAAVQSALLILLGAMANNSSTPDGAASLLDALDRDHDGGVLDDIGGFLGNFNSNDGLGILGHVFGRDLGAVQSGLGKTSRLGAGSAGQLLAMLAPVVMGALGRAQRQEGLDASSLAGYLSSASQQMGGSSTRRLMKNRYLQGIAVLALLANFGCSNQPESQANKSAASAGEARDQAGLRKIAPAELRFDPSSSTAVISSAQKFIIPVPAFGRGGEPLVYPKGHEKAGQPILDYEGKPIGERGLVFFNAKDQAVQAVAGDGQGVIIINEVTEEQAEKLSRKISEFSPDPNKLTLSQMKQTLDFARTALKLGDMYNSTRSFVRTKMTPAVAGQVPRAGGKEIEDYGLKKRDDRDVCHAVYVPGKFVFEGPAASAQVFENGGVIVEQGGKFRGVQPEVFVRTYRLLDGQQIASLTRDLKAWQGE